MASFAWPSVMVLKGSKVVINRTILKCSWSENFASVLERLGSEYSSELVSKIIISSNDRLVDPAHSVPIDAPINILETYGCHYICYNVCEEAIQGQSQANEARNAATVLMQRARQLVLPPSITPSSDSEPLRADHTLRNDIIQYLLEKKVGWSPTTVLTTGEQFVKILTAAALWYLDPHHKQLEER